MAKKWIDAHGHFATPGKSSVGRAPGLAANARPWTFAPETSIDYMDKTEVAAQIISNCNQMASVDAIRASNDYGASLVAKYPTRFGFLAQSQLLFLRRNGPSQRMTFLDEQVER